MLSHASLPDSQRKEQARVADEDIPPIGPIKRARTKLINQQVNSFLNDFNITNKNMSLPNSFIFYLCSYIHTEACEIENKGARSIEQKL